MRPEAVRQLRDPRLYLELLPMVNAGTIELDNPRLLRELRSLERRRGTAGRDRIDHRPGEHDDLANVVAGVAHLARVAPDEDLSRRYFII